MKTFEYITCECELGALKDFVISLEKKYHIDIAKAPAICLTMIKAEDSLELQAFYLGEALTTECEVVINSKIGYGICLGDEPIRAYCMAVIESLMQLNDSSKGAIEEFLNDQYEVIQQQLKVEHNHILRSKVDFKLMENE